MEPLPNGLHAIKVDESLSLPPLLAAEKRDPPADRRVVGRWRGVRRVWTGDPRKKEGRVVDVECGCGSGERDSASYFETVYIELLILVLSYRL